MVGARGERPSACARKTLGCSTAGAGAVKEDGKEASSALRGSTMSGSACKVMGGAATGEEGEHILPRCRAALAHLCACQAHAPHDAQPVLQQLLDQLKPAGEQGRGTRMSPCAVQMHVSVVRDARG